MATGVLVTVDTELSPALHQRGVDSRANFASSILGRCPAGDFGVGWQMDRLEEAGLAGVFFVDPMPGLVYGDQIVADMVGPIVARGHEAQLHIHTEWLEWAKESPVGGRRGRNIGDFSLEDQIALIGLARDMLVRAGAPSPIAFRAGNFGADDNTPRALAALGIPWGASVNPAYLGGECRMSFDAHSTAPIARGDVTILPVSGLHDLPGRFRPAQVCAISAREMRAALGHAAAHAQPAFVIVTHSFEMLSRDRRRPDRRVIARFEAMCRALADHPGLRSAGFRDLDPAALAETAADPAPLLPPSYIRTAGRMAEQAVSAWLTAR